MQDNVALQAGIAFAFDTYVLVYGDYLKQFPGMLGGSNTFMTQLTPYVGIGPIVGVATNTNHDNSYFNKRSDNLSLGARVPFGIEWMAPNFPLGISLELAPGIVIIPTTNGIVQGAANFLYYF